MTPKKSGFALTNKDVPFVAPVRRLLAGEAAQLRRLRSLSHFSQKCLELTTMASQAPFLRARCVRFGGGCVRLSSELETLNPSRIEDETGDVPVGVAVEPKRAGLADKDVL